MIRKVNISLMFGLICLLIQFITIDCYCQTYKQEALKKFSKQDYTGGIEILKKAEKDNGDDPELYCMLGHYYHYRAYDSRPLINYNRQYSDSIISFLDKAISIKPDYREPYYWLFAEYGARALEALLNKNIAGCRNEYQTALNKGVMPKWVLEWGRNALNSCDKDAILFTCGDVCLNSITYIQLIENYRKDVTVIPVGFAELPICIKFYKYGIKNRVTPVKIRFSDGQIMQIRPFKWDTLSVNIRIAELVKKKYKIENNYFKWELTPDMTSAGSSYMSPWRAFFAEIIEANSFERPIYFTDGFWEGELGGLIPYTTDCGIVRKLVPFLTKDTPFEIDKEVMEKFFFNKDNFRYFKDVETNNFPDRNQILLNYYGDLWRLADFYNKNGEKDKIAMIMDLLKGDLCSSALFSDRYLNMINNIYKK